MTQETDGYFIGLIQNALASGIAAEQIKLATALGPLRDETTL